MFAGTSHRARVLVALGTLALLAIVGVAAWALTKGADSYATRSADERARLGADLLVGVGRNLPDLSPATLSRGLSPGELAQLDHAVAVGQRQGLLLNLLVWDRTGRVVYSASDRMEGTRPALEPEVARALAGADIALRHPEERNPATGRITGALDALEALRDDSGGIYGAVEVSLPLAPITADAAATRRRILIYLFGGAAVLWLALLPLTVRAARHAAEVWVPGRRRTLQAFSRALASGDIELVYQPQVRSKGNRVEAVEALVRWRRAGQLEPPSSFLPIVEQSRLITDLTERVLDLGLGQLAVWRAAGHQLRLSVNLSAANLTDLGLPASIEAALARHGIPSSALAVEITETAVYEDPKLARRVVCAITRLGVQVAIDDFGTGHASISRLHSLPISELKIDRSFVMATDEQSRAYLTGIVRFAHGLGLRCVAEGVEDEQTLALLAELDCDLVQGYYIARPLPARDVEPWLTDREGQRPPVRVMDRVEAPVRS